MPGSEIQPFNVTEHIRQQVREVLIASIPDEQMDAMIKAEVRLYFQVHQDQYSRKDVPSEFSTQLRRMIEQYIAERLKIWFDSNFQTIWEETGGRMVGALVAKFVPIVQAEMAQNIAERALMSIRNQLR